MNNNEEFIYIEDLKNDILRYTKEINLKCTQLEEIYQEYIQEAIKKPDYLTSLDILFFQLELTKEDIKNYSNLFNSFLSKVYGQYYKFYHKILNNLKDNHTLDIFNDTQIFYEFTPYDDIYFKMYSFEETQKIHNVITTIINCINQYISKERYKIEDDNIRIKKGININHLVFEKNHFIEIFNNKSNLFDKILSNYYEYQKKYLKRIILKLKLLFYQIDSDIQFESVTRSPDPSPATSPATLNITQKMTKIENEIESIILNKIPILNKIEIPPVKKPSENIIKVKNNSILVNFLKLLYTTFFKKINWIIL